MVLSKQFKNNFEKRPQTKTLYRNKTPYHDLYVQESGNIRGLISGSGMASEQSSVDILDLHKHVYDYSLLAMYSLCFVPNPSAVLVVGLGGGVIPRELNHYFPNLKIDILEIDPEIITVAKQFFFFEESEGVKVHIGDAFATIKNMTQKYDIVVLDAFLSEYTPFHLMTKEFLSSLKSVCTFDAVVVVNASNIYVSFGSQILTLVEILGNNPHILHGPTNNLVDVFYFPLSECSLNSLQLPSIYYPDLLPLKFHLTEEIKKAKIFRLENV